MWGQSIAFEQAYEVFFHSVKKLFVIKACLHVLHYMYLYMSS